MANNQYIDNGNGRFKAKSSTGYKGKMLATVGSGFVRKHSFPSQSQDDGFLPTDQIHVAVKDLNKPSSEPVEYFVGLLARNESKDGERVFNNDSMTDPRIAIAVGTMSALMNPHNQPVDKLCVGLPLGIFHEKKDELQRFLQETNLQIQFRSGSMAGKDTPIIFRPRKVELYPQAGAGLYACLFHKDGTLKVSRPGLYAGVDIGWGTTDFMVVEVLPNGTVRVRGDMTDTIGIGLSRTVDLTRSSLENKYGNVNQNEFENQLMTDPSNISFKGQSFNLSQPFKSVKEQIALSIKTGIKRKWGDKADYIVKTFLFGGGAIDLGDFITDGFPAATIEIPDEPDLVNLEGYEVMSSLANQ